MIMPKLEIINSAPTRRAYLAILEWISRPIVEAAPHWPQSYSDVLFIPERNFEQRRRSRRFLKWIISLGVNANKWLDHLENNEQTPIEPPQTISGGVGRAYIIGDKVVKLTTDNKEALRASAFTGLDIPNLTKFDGVVAIDNVLGNRPLYAIVMNRVPNRIPGRYRVAANAVYNYLDAYDRPIVDIDQAAREIVSSTKFLPIKYRNDANVRSGIIKILSAIDTIYRRTGIMLQDPHGSNVLMRGNDIEFFDVGRSSDYGNAISGSQISHIT